MPSLASVSGCDLFRGFGELEEVDVALIAAIEREVSNCDWLGSTYKILTQKKSNDCGIGYASTSMCCVVPRSLAVDIQGDASQLATT